MDQPAAILSFRVTEDGTMSLVLEANNVVDKLNPNIMISFDKKGGTRLNLGMGDLLVEPIHLGDDLRKLIRAVPGTEEASVKLPPCSQLRTDKGGFMTFDEYKRKQIQIAKGFPLAGEWPDLTPHLYEEMVRLYRANNFACSQ